MVFEVEKTVDQTSHWLPFDGFANASAGPIRRAESVSRRYSYLAPRHVMPSQKVWTISGSRV
jgi:hypothetical protein